MAAEAARPPLGARKSAAKVNSVANRANMIDEADKENGCPKSTLPAAKGSSLADRKATAQFGGPAPVDQEAQLAERERAIALREKKVNEQNRIHEEKLMDMEVLQMRLKDQKRALNERDRSSVSSKSLEHSRTMEQMLVSTEYEERTAKIVAREQELAAAESACSAREQDLGKREETQQRAERKLRAQEASATGEHRSAQAETVLAAKERSLAAREKALLSAEGEFKAKQAREESMKEREARVTRLESALGERESRVMKECAGLAAQAKGMADRSSELALRDSAVAGRQRQLETRAAGLAKESARLSNEAARVTAERLALRGEASELEAQRAAFAAACASKVGVRSAHVFTEEAEPTWHSVADGGAQSPAEFSDSSDEPGYQAHSAASAAARMEAGSLDELLRFAELTGNTSPVARKGRSAVASKGVHAPAAPTPRPDDRFHSRDSLAQAQAKSVRFVSAPSRLTAGAGLSGSASVPCGMGAANARGPAVASSSSGLMGGHGRDGASSKHLPSQSSGGGLGLGTSARLQQGSFVSTFGETQQLSAAALKIHSSGCKAGSRDRFTIGGMGDRPDLVESDRTSIASSMGGKSSQVRLTARKKVQAPSAAHDGYSGVAASGGSCGLAAATSGPPSPVATRAPARSTCGPMPSREAESTATGPLARLTAPFSALRRSLGGALASSVG